MPYVHFADLSLPDWASDLVGLELFVYIGKLAIARLMPKEHYRGMDFGKVVALPTPLDVAYMGYQVYRDRSFSNARRALQGNEFEW